MPTPDTALQAASPPHCHHPAASPLRSEALVHMPSLFTEARPSAPFPLRPWAISSRSRRSQNKMTDPTAKSRPEAELMPASLYPPSQRLSQALCAVSFLTSGSSVKSAGLPPRSLSCHYPPTQPLHPCAHDCHSRGPVLS